MRIKKFISVLLIFVLMTEIILGASSAYGMDMPLNEKVTKEIDTVSQEDAVSELSRKINEYISDESSMLQSGDTSMDSLENQVEDNGLKEDIDIPEQNYENMPVSSLLNLNAPSQNNSDTDEEENNVGTQSKFTLSGYIMPDFIGGTISANSGFKVEILGTNFSAETNDEGFFTIAGSADLQAKYILQITKTGFLRRQIGDLTLSGLISIGDKDNPVKMWAGDIPKDGVQDDTINMSDVIQIAMNFNKIDTSTDFNKWCDLNDDGSINMADVIIMAKHFNATSTSYDAPKVNIIIDDEKPSAPQNLKSLWNTGASISLEWQKATDNISIDRYEIYCNDKLIALTKETSLVCSGMIPNKMNTIYVKSVDSSGNISNSSNILKV